MQKYSSFDELAEAFHNKVTLIRQKHALKDTDRKESLYSSVEGLVKELTLLLTVMKADVSRRKAQLEKTKELRSEVTAMMVKVDHASGNLPSHLPQKMMPPPQPQVAVQNSFSQSRIPVTPKMKRFAIPETPSTVSQNTPTTEQIKRKSQTLFLPALDFITVEEFEAVPKYMRGRTSYSQVNAAVDDFNKTLAIKYNTLAVPKQKRSEKVKAAIRKYKEQENKDTKGLNFVTEVELKAHSRLRMDKASHTMLTILRHCGRIREVRSKGLVRYAVTSH